MTRLYEPDFSTGAPDSRCKDGQYFSTSSNRCLECSGKFRNSLRCTEDEALSCDYGYLDNGNCVRRTVCLGAYYVSPRDGTCFLCTVSGSECGVVRRVWDIDHVQLRRGDRRGLSRRAEATDTRLGPDGADSRVQRSTLTKLESILRTGNRFVREFASAKAHAGWDTAKEWILRLCLPPGRDRRTHNLPTSSTEMAMLICASDTNTGDRGPQDLILQVHGDRCPDGEDGSHPNIPFCGFHQAGPPIARNREQIDNGVQLRELLAGLGPQMKKTNRRTKTATMRMKTARKGTKRMVMANVRVFGSFSEDEGQVKGSRWRVSRSQFFAHYLPKATSTSQSRIATNVPSWTIPGCDGVRCQTWKASAAHQDDVRPRLTGNQGCTGADKACNRPDHLIARVFEAKSGNKHMQAVSAMNTVRLSCYFLNFILPLI
ncbi:BQ5605_C015g07850 [Microbotryum silenes-dioicae]|uniref:BQ5605_C015g07850 protein n=1 Tax=Microbotryum silenes-dioicae TaxID=796604 RepID=A0A2X0LSZ8_9BASI|nr:BQ5605_C015g07850 [Microbotryum silenes-dioicae]